MNYDVIPLVDPKLARGLVREELRHLKKLASHAVHQKLADDMSVAWSRMRPGRKISNTTGKKIRDQLYDQAKRALSPIFEYRSKIPVTDDAQIAREATGFLYWFMAEQEVVNPTLDDGSYSAYFLELRMHRYAADRRRIVMDDFFCNLCIGDHALIRMIERGAVDRQPLKTLSDNIETLVHYTALFNMLYMSDHGKWAPRVLIPFKDGALLCKMGEGHDGKPEEEGYHHRFRVQIDAHSRDVTEPPFPSFFSKGTGSKPNIQILQISTFISYDQLSTEQFWAIHRLNTLLSDESKNLHQYFKMIVSPESCDSTAIPAIKQVLVSMREICKDSRWGLATNSIARRS